MIEIVIGREYIHHHYHHHHHHHRETVLLTRRGGMKIQIHLIPRIKTAAAKERKE
jgi:hypothetical protein